MALKEMVYEYAKAHRHLTRKLGNPHRLEARILADGRRARHEDLYITANFLRREVHLYIGKYPQGQCYRMEVEGRKPSGLPLRILHTGNVYNGHY